MARYIVWDRETPVITPIGEFLSAAQWIARYPAAAYIKTVCSGGEVNGAFYGVFSTMIDMYTKQGCDFSGCESDQEYLDAIEAFEDLMNTPSNEPTAEERIAAAMEYQNALAE